MPLPGKMILKNFIIIVENMVVCVKTMDLAAILFFAEYLKLPKGADLAFGSFSMKGP